MEKILRKFKLNKLKQIYIKISYYKKLLNYDMVKGGQYQ